ncbi:RNA polymerase II mediator complex subunit, partial [Coemansia spiralis]
DARVFQELQAFAAGAAQRQRARGQITSTEVPALPNRAVRSDERREEWVRGLANARVPLSTLATSMPHGLRGERLLETLRAHWVPLQRAMWAIRMTGVYEMVALQTRAPDQASIKALEQQYTGQWSRQFTQFVEHTLAIAPTGTGSATTTPVVPAVEGASPAPAAASAGTPASWAQSWSFCLALLHAQYNQGLLDQRHMVSWLGTQLSQMAVDRCLLLLPVVRDYTAEIAKSRTPLRRLISAVVHRIDQAAKYRALQPMHVAFGEYLVELFTAHPDAFVEPSTWGPYRAALEHAVDTVHGDSERAALRRAIAQVDSRNAHFAGLVGGSDSAAPAPAARPLADADARLAPLRVLGALGPDSDLEKAFAELFETSTQAAAAHTLRLLCYWATEGPLPAAAARFRPLAAAHLCRLYLNHLGKAAGADGALHLRRMQGAIVGFLDILALPSDARRADTVRRVCVLLERLGDVGCFSISHYLELLT